LYGDLCFQLFFDAWFCDRLIADSSSRTMIGLECFLEPFQAEAGLALLPCWSANLLFFVGIIALCHKKYDMAHFCGIFGLILGGGCLLILLTPSILLGGEPRFGYFLWLASMLGLVFSPIAYCWDSDRP
jgi:hypothetical protein